MQGAGTQVSVVVERGSLYSQAFLGVSYAAPRLTGISGCKEDKVENGINKTIGCPRSGGGVQLTLTGVVC